MVLSTTLTAPFRSTPRSTLKPARCWANRVLSYQHRVCGLELAMLAGVKGESGRIQYPDGREKPFRHALSSADSSKIATEYASPSIGFGKTKESRRIFSRC